MDQAKNFAKGSLATAIDEDDVSVDVQAGEGARFPAVPFNAVVWNVTDYPDPADDPDVEIVRVTAKATDTLTITRGQEGTAGTPHEELGKTYQIIAPLTAKFINDNGPALDRISDVSDIFRINANEGVLLALDRLSGTASLGDVDGIVEGTKIVINDPATTVTITKQLILPDLPTSNPAVAGALWNDSGTVKISAG